MTWNVILRPDADTDIQTTHDELELQHAGRGKRFITQLRELLGRIEGMPEIYAPVWQDVRAARMRKSRYVVYYLVFTDRVEVLAVLHGARRDRVWQSRL